MTAFALDFLNDLERELQDLARRDVTPRRHRRWFAAGLALAAVGLAFALALTLNLDGASRPGSELGGPASASAAIARARAALTPPRGGIFHVRIEFREQGGPVEVNEIWQSPAAYRATTTGRPEGGGRKDGTQELYDRARNIIYAARLSHVPPSSLLTAYAADARRTLRAGARILGHARIGGIDCLRIENTSVPGVTDTLYVDSRSYRPVLERETGTTARSEFRFRDWQVLAPTAATRRLADLRLVHPHARVVDSKKAFYAAEVRLLHLLPGPPGQPPRPQPILRP